MSGAATVTIREAGESDIDQIVEVGHRTWRATYLDLAGSDYVEASLARWWTPEAIGREVAAGRVTVAVADEQVLGIASAGPLRGDLVLFKLYVDPQRQRQGIGDQLIHAVLTAAREGGHQIIRLSYLDGNDGACDFYAGHGFRETHRERVGDGIPDLVWVVKDLWADAS